MTHIETVAVTAQATFGRDGAMFNGLLGFVAQLSVVLWSLVILTAVIRFVGIRIYRRGAPVPTATAEKDAVLVPAELVDVLTTDAVTNATFDAVLQPAEAQAAVAASVKVPRPAHRNRRAEHRSAAHVHAFASHATEA